MSADNKLMITRMDHKVVDWGCRQIVAERMPGISPVLRYINPQFCSDIQDILIAGILTDDINPFRWQVSRD
jgi:hypothetical protein